ncbi:hypothetical protein ACRRTK_023822 [Alexandromys fortis]
MALSGRVLAYAYKALDSTEIKSSASHMLVHVVIDGTTSWTKFFKGKIHIQFILYLPSNCLLFVLLCDGANALCVCHIDTSMFCEKQELCEPGILVRSAERTGGTEDTVTESKTTQRSKHRMIMFPCSKPTQEPCTSPSSKHEIVSKYSLQMLFRVSTRKAFTGVRVLVHPEFYVRGMMNAKNKATGNGGHACCAFTERTDGHCQSLTPHPTQAPHNKLVLDDTKSKFRTSSFLAPAGPCSTSPKAAQSTARKVVAVGVLPRMMEPMTSLEFNILSHFLQTMGNIVPGTDLQTWIAMDAGMLEALVLFLKFLKADILDWTLGNMTARRSLHPEADLVRSANNS